MWETKLGEKKHKEITSINEIARKVEKTGMEKILMLLKVEIKMKIISTILGTQPFAIYSSHPHRVQDGAMETELQKSKAIFSH